MYLGDIFPEDTKDFYSFSLFIKALEDEMRKKNLL
jgi:hypothetical protein